MMDNYPPGHPTGNAEAELTFICRNDECVAEDEKWTVPAIHERDTNACYPVDEDGTLCPACGEEGDDA
ncbi:MAG: hypothetical protein LC798_12945 [Chloroflexi bacterium]|nr:hypothetical protein [Chloroflexota bacterium]